jgi:hypothetical protein
MSKHRFVASLQIDFLRRWSRELLVQKKNMDIERFRLELDVILNAARELALVQKRPLNDNSLEARVSSNKRSVSAQPLRVLNPNSHGISRP